MLRKGSSVSRHHSMVTSDTTIEDETELVGYDLDDPDSLWQRPALQYVANQWQYPSTCLSRGS